MDSADAVGRPRRPQFRPSPRCRVGLDGGVFCTVATITTGNRTCGTPRCLLGELRIGLGERLVPSAGRTVRTSCRRCRGCEIESQPGAAVETVETRRRSIWSAMRFVASAPVGQVQQLGAPFVVGGDLVVGTAVRLGDGPRTCSQISSALRWSASTSGLASISSSY